MKKGISLAALVITIIVLIILTTAVVLTLVDTSILDKADEAKEKQNEQEVYSLVQREVLNLQSEDYRLEIGQGFEDKLREKLKEKYPEAKTEVTLEEENVKIKYTLNNETYNLLLDKEYKLILDQPVEIIPISTTDSYIGYYADIDGDNNPDGIIYADLAFSLSGKRANNSGSFEFSYKAKTGLKDYYVSKTDYEGIFGTKDVLTAKGTGEDRFYIMALEDVNPGTKYTWYDAAYDTKITDYSTVTSTSFGTGKTNTKTMLEKWNSSAYGTQNDHGTYYDMWGAIKDKVASGWFVPSKVEWSAFVYNLEININNYTSYNLLRYCWSSSLGSTSGASRTDLNNGMFGSSINEALTVRLSATF